MEKILRAGLCLLAGLFFLVSPALSQSFLNGSFENTTAGIDRINLSNAAFNGYMANANSFGTNGNLDIIRSATWGGSGAQHQTWYLALTGSLTDMLAMELSAPLIAGSTYTLSFWDRKDAGFQAFPVQLSLSTSNSSFGTLIYTAPLASNNTWTQRTFTFTAPNNGQYVIVTQNGGAVSTSWVHVDNFELACATPTLTLTPPASICRGAAQTLTVSGATSYTWSPATGLSATTGSIVSASPASATTYSVLASVGTCTASASTKVDVDPGPSLSASPASTTICAGTSAQLSASGAVSYSWTPAASLDTDHGPDVKASPLQTTVYTVTGSNGSCTASRTVEVTVMPAIAVQATRFGDVCFGGSTTIQASGGTTYTWQPAADAAHANAATTEVRPLTTTVYTVMAESPGLCAASATLEVIVNPMPRVYAGRDTTVNMDEPITLTGTDLTPNGKGRVVLGFLPPGSGPLLCNFCNTITVNPMESTCYVLKGESGDGCVGFDTVCVSVTKDYEVFIPNAFTPNADGCNDVFIPVGYGLSKIRLTIFDRWGTRIFTSPESGIGWDGSYKGKPCEQGVYIYKAEIQTMAGATVEREGHVMLLPKSVFR